uniref:Uncharacterized protein n=1 Tax=Oryza glumipatula TaxID=40148 RepID=A0A0E0A5M9_9ORYZ
MMDSRHDNWQQMLVVICRGGDGVATGGLESKNPCHHIQTDENAGVLEEVADLASRCLEMIGNNRPSMRDVADKLG